MVEKKPLYVQLMKEGHSNRAECRILGINPNTGLRWLHGRNGVEGLVQQGLDPRPRKAIPATGGSSRYLSEDERIFIADRLLVGASLQSIARDLGRSPSTISRELARNRPDKRRYHPFRAQKMAQRRRPRPRLAKLAGDDELRHYVVECLSKRRSPQQVCRALKERFPGEKHRHLAHERVYRALYHLSIRPVPTGSARLLRSGKFSRRPRSRTKVKPRHYMADALKIGDRPDHIATREEAGHWEGDLIVGKGNKSAIVTLVERSSRLLVAFALRPGNRSDNMRDQLIDALGVMPATLRRTLTWDRGSEMAKHAEVTAALGTLVYFCDPASPWQRASNENANGLLRQYFRKGADLSTVEQAEVRFAADVINGRPRAVLDWESATARFASLQTIAALHTKAVSDGTENAALLPTAGDNSIGLSTATATRELPQRLPIPAVDNPN
ncbi:IS30 family transposase [Arthrobacter sp. ZGTC131]|uniref:IS30 family transposase n=1 Tax=Arthrobacter sp. ZGTC131 TaxID=2058898 RepID=UPI0015E30701|nr:IS30 family transposase [Arthrobacter sp. ZGTC131]